MAFLNRIGSILGQSISQSSNSSMMTAIRYMSSSKLFVGGLSFATDDGNLKDAFSSFGEVVDARVITDRNTGRSRGFGFVNFADAEAANSALSAMDGQDLNGRNIRVSVANERTPGPPRGGGGGYGGGGYGGGGYGGGGGGYGGGGYGGQSRSNDDF
ncbi:glycine-rich RNA-binding protein 2, mitochondrial-like [Chenopodium quinoa]|uniref:glycine-rich RNA-binding protein 2, mitochondrial-like n=1 Tax=Chenopodium quinoa TaxID=63459 RepID=UPI000B76BBF5|nr:glycine-rich RNA-binding protein 2, mitochondrial-like [Chenopodium quinoa]